MDRNQARRAAAFSKDLAYTMARGLRRDKRYIDVLRRLDSAEADVEAVRKHQRLARPQIGRNVLRIGLALRVVRRQDHDDVGPGRGIADRTDLQAGLLGLVDGLAALRQPDANFYARVLKIERVGVPLRAVADNGYLLLLDDGQVRVLIVVRLRHCVSSVSFWLIELSVMTKLGDPRLLRQICRLLNRGAHSNIGAGFSIGSGDAHGVENAACVLAATHDHAARAGN